MIGLMVKLMGGSGVYVIGGIAAVLVFLLVIFTAYFIGLRAGRDEARDAAFDQIKERNLTDEKVRDMPDAALCRSIGGELQVDGRCI